MQTLSACPVCHNSNFTAFLSSKDYTVSHETFSLVKCESCNLVLTNPQPGENELPKYYQSDAYISHSNKTKNLIDHLYKISRNYTLKWKYNLTQTHSIEAASSLLDYGCGTGAFLKVCQEKNMLIAGVEPSAIARAEAARITNIPIASTLDELTRTYDVITLWHVLEHVSNLDTTLSKLEARLEKNGTMFIAVPNLNSRDAKIYREHWAAYDVPRHLWHFSKKSMEKTLASYSLKINAILPMRLDAYYVCLLSEKYRGNTGLSGMLNAFTQGWNSNQEANSTHEYSSLIYIVRK